MPDASHKRQKNAPHVLYLISSLMAGGAERLMIDLLRCHASASPNNGTQIFYVVMNNLVDEGYREELEQSGAKGWLFGRKQGHKHPRYFHMLHKIVRQHGIGVVHAHTPGSKYWGMLLKLANPGLKLVYTVHSETDVTRYKGTKLQLHRTAVNWNIAVSKAVHTQCLHMGLLKSSVIYNGVELAPIRQRPLVPFPRCPHFVMVSRLVPEIKGQDILLRAVAHCREKGFHCSVTFVGDTEGRYRQAYWQLQGLAKQLALPEGAIYFTGLRNDIADLLAEYDGYISASRQEGLGLSIIQAMAAGLPVVSSNTGGPLELVTEGETGYLFESGSATALAETILRVYQNPNQPELKRVTQRANQFAQQFNIGRMYREYIALYRQVMNNKQTKGNKSFLPTATKGGSLEDNA